MSVVSRQLRKSDTVDQGNMLYGYIDSCLLYYCFLFLLY
jgi:hypothetical protein